MPILTKHTQLQEANANFQSGSVGVRFSNTVHLTGLKAQEQENTPKSRRLLPTEIYAQIFEQVDSAALQSLCLVSRRASHEATRVLYHDITLKRTNRSLKRDQIRLLSRTLRFNPKLACHVRLLTIQYWFYPDLLDKDNEIKADYLLQHLANLRSLTLLQSGRDVVWGSTCPRWLMRCPVSVENLHTDFCFVDVPEFFGLHPNLVYLGASEVPNDVFRVLPRLTSMRIGDLNPFAVFTHNITQLSAIYHERHKLCWNTGVIAELGPRLLSLHLELAGNACAGPAVDQLLCKCTPNLQFLWLQSSLHWAPLESEKQAASDFSRDLYSRLTHSCYSCGLYWNA